MRQCENAPGGRGPRGAISRQVYPIHGKTIHGASKTGRVQLPASFSFSQKVMAFRLPCRHLARLCKTSTLSAPRNWVPPTGSIASLHQIAANPQQHVVSVFYSVPQQRPACSPCWAVQRRLKHAGKKGEYFFVCVRGLMTAYAMGIPVNRKYRSMHTDNNSSSLFRVVVSSKTSGGTW